jgi:hypothetical protein
MPYSITTKDGITLQNIPDDVPKDSPQLKARVLKIRSERDNKAFMERANPVNDMSTTERVLAGVGQGMSAVGSAAANGLNKLAHLTGRGASADFFGIKGRSPEEIEEAKKTDANLLNTSAGKVGSVAGQASLAVPTAFIPGANTALGAGLIGAGTGALTTEGGVQERLQGAGYGAAGGVAANALGKVLGAGAKSLGERMAAKRAAQEVAGAQKASAIKAAQEAGYVLPPTEVKPSFLNEALEGLSGKVKTAQAASAQNQQITNALAKKALGVADESPLTGDALKAIRKGAGEAYESIKGAGPIKADEAYAKALNGLKSQYEGAAKDFPGLAKAEVSDLVEALNKKEFGADSAIDAIRVLRESADKAFRAGDTGVAKANKGAAGALEELIERNLSGEKLSAFRDARKTIAKTYTVEKALNPETGDVSAQVLAGLLKKGKPLSGELETIAQTGMAFPKATQALKESYKAISPLDYATAAIGGTATGNPLMLATVAARPAARSLVLSRIYQSNLSPEVKAGLLAKALENGQKLKAPQRVAPAMAALLANSGQQ